jgi:lipid II:glycine glycyltransferase (peptidoglycan interpeptide bridge formation enzyme)
LRSILTGNRLVSIPYATLCDPLVATADQMERLMQALLDLAEALRMKTSEIRTFQCGLCSSDDRFWNQNIYRHHYILLDREPEKIKQSFDRTNVRQRIQRAQKSDIVVEKAEHASDMADFYKLHIMTRKKLGLPPQPLKFFKHLWNTFAPAQQLTLLFAKKDNEILSSIIMFKFKDRVSVEFLASNEAFMSLSPNHMLFWEGIQSAYNEGYKIFDFGRTAVANESLMNFKKRWGTVVVDLPQYYYPKQAFAGYQGPEETLAYKLVRKAVIKLPENACLLLSKFLYRHLG